jgi:collagen type III alpha
MRQTNDLPGHLHPLSIPAAAAARDRNRVSVFTHDSVATTGFTPSPVSPMSPSTMFSPGTVRTSRPIQEPPDPRIVAAANARVTRGSLSSIDTGSGISAALSPGQLAWPMPPGPSPAIQHPDGPQYLNFQQSGETVVRINQPQRSNRRSGGY